MGSICQNRVRTSRNGGRIRGRFRSIGRNGWLGLRRRKSIGTGSLKNQSRFNLTLGWCVGGFDLQSCCQSHMGPCLFRSVTQDRIYKPPGQVGKLSVSMDPILATAQLNKIDCISIRFVSGRFRTVSDLS